MSKYLLFKKSNLNAIRGAKHRIIDLEYELAICSDMEKRAQLEADLEQARGELAELENELAELEGYQSLEDRGINY